MGHVLRCGCLAAILALAHGASLRAAPASNYDYMVESGDTAK